MPNRALDHTWAGRALGVFSRTGHDCLFPIHWYLTFQSFSVGEIEANWHKGNEGKKEEVGHLISQKAAGPLCK